jgi:hypothetical protein
VIIETKNLAAAIKKAGKAQRIAEFQFPFLPEVYFKISYASKFMLNQIREVAREVWTNPRTRSQEERFNDEKLRAEYCRHIIRDWRGLTVGKLRKIVPGIDAGEGVTDETELGYSFDVASALLEVSLEFEGWVIDTATNVENYSKIAEIKADQLENLT